MTSVSYHCRRPVPARCMMVQSQTTFSTKEFVFRQPPPFSVSAELPASRPSIKSWRKWQISRAERPMNCLHGIQILRLRYTFNAVLLNRHRTRSLRWINLPGNAVNSRQHVVPHSTISIQHLMEYWITVCAIQLLDQTSFGAVWKPTCLPVVSR